MADITRNERKKRIILIFLLSVSAKNIIYYCLVLQVDNCRIIFFFFQAEDGIRDIGVTGVQTCALPILAPVQRYGPPPNARDRLLPAGEDAARDIPHRDHDLGVHRGELRHQVGPAGAHLRGLRRPGRRPRRTALVQGGQVGPLAVEPRRGEQAVEQHPGGPPEGLALPVLVEAWSLPHDEELGVERSEEHTSELQSRQYLVCRLLLEKKNRIKDNMSTDTNSPL